jgi:TrmH family RNA methyltransferase
LPLLAGLTPAELFAQCTLPLFSAEPRATQLLAAANLTTPCALVIGSEGRGVSQALSARATGLRIPTAQVESLNAAIAAGVLLYEAHRQRSSS